MVSSPGCLTAMPSAIVIDAVASTGSPRWSDSTYGAHAATWTPTTSTSGRADLTAIATPLHSPPPPTGTTTLARSGHLLEQLEPERALAGDDVGVVERVDEREPALARALLRGDSGTRRPTSPPRCTIAPWPRAASVLAIGASAGTKTSHGTPMRARRRGDAPARGCRPRRRPRRPRSPPRRARRASRRVPRTLKEPVRWRFSAFSATVPPARSEIVRVESTGVRRAVVATAARAASMSRPVTGEDSTVATR